MAPGVDEPTINQDAGTSGQAASHERLWTPWRMRYVGGAKSESGCIFCNRLAADDDRQSLILHRDEHAFVIMNLYPYNTGHTMLVPREHIPSPELADPASITAMSHLRPPLLRATRRALSCQGFNLGMNIGAVAGAGITEHVHEHVVPRWTGDANFMPILANTMVMPELIPVTYAKLRAELVRELAGVREVGCLVAAADSQLLLVDKTGHAPRVFTLTDEPVWLSATRVVRDLCGADSELVGWAGAGRAGGPTIQLEFRAGAPEAGSLPAPTGWRWVTRADTVCG